MSSKQLGRGLSALLGDEPKTESLQEKTATIQIENLKPGKMQPRKNFNDESINNLAISIKEKGVLQPLIVRWINEEENQAEIIAGERRWRAAKIANLKEVPVIVVDYNDLECLEVGLIENLQREDLNAIEEAESIQDLIKKHNKTQDEVSRVVGKSRSYVANTLRLLTLPEEIKNQVRAGQLSPSHARTLINKNNAEELAQNIIEKKMSVRDAEKVHTQAKSEDALFLEKEIEKILHLKADLKIKGDGSGEVKLYFSSMEQLDFFVRKIS